MKTKVVMTALNEAAPQSHAAQATVEDLSGWRYDQLWGRNPVAR